MKKYFFIRKLHFIFTPSIHLNTKNNQMDYQLISECQSEAIRYYDEAIELIKKTAYAAKDTADDKKIKEAMLIILQAAIQAQLSATEAINSADDHNPESEIEPRNLDEYRASRAEDWAQFGYSR